MIAFVALIVVGAVQLAGSSSSDELGAAADGIDKAEGGSGGSGGTGDTGGGPGGSGSTTVPTTASTVPQTTPSTTPSSTSSTTSTTSTTTTTTAPEPDGPIVAGSSIDHIDTTSLGGSDWEASTTITITDESGDPVEGAIVTVRVREYTIKSNGRWGWENTSTDLVTGPDGTLDIDVGPFDSEGGDPVTAVRVQVRDVDVGDAGEWDGSRQSRTGYAP